MTSNHKVHEGKVVQHQKMGKMDEVRCDLESLLRFKAEIEVFVFEKKIILFSIYNLLL